MIITETITINNKECIKNYSDEGFYMQKVGTDEIYSEAIDPIDSGRTYIETDKLIDDDEDGEISGEDFLSMIKEVL
jgi:hypothetical protein